jgi:hypothetical protein
MTAWNFAPGDAQASDSPHNGVKWGNAGTPRSNQSRTRKHTPTSSAAVANEQESDAAAKRWKRLLVFFIRLGSLAALAVITWINWQPYIGVVHYLLGPDSDHPMIRWIIWALTSLPLIGGIFDFLFNAIRSVFLHFLGVLVWCLFQALELIPLMLSTDTSIKSMIYGFAHFKPITINDGDTVEVKRLKRKYNSKPKEWIWTANIIATMAYLGDALFCWIWYPPVKNIKLFLIAPSMDQIDFRNLGLMLLTMFAFEGAIALWLFLIEGKRFWGLGQQQGA